ncbi:MAG: beta-lactamase family protein [Gammaproteobacteria bacterium]|nr:beta-lactamase family protein [Gammaproteobacteria bacterium]
MTRHMLIKTLVRQAAFLAVGLALSIGSHAGQRDLAIVDPAEVGMSADGLAELSAAMQGFVDRGELAGVVTLVARHGKIAHFETFGKQDLESGVPMAKDTIFRIYSMTKPVAGVALMTFYEEGRFKLDDPVAKYVPEFADLKVAKAPGPEGQPIVEDANHAMTIRELVSHTAGLTYGFFSRSQVDALYVQANVLDRNSTLKDMIVKLADIPLRQQPGSAWHYSVAVDVQGYLVEVLAGKPFDEVLKERIFDPLGMNDTGFWIAPEDEPRTATMYQQRGGGTLAPNPSREYFTKPAFFSGGGGLGHGLHALRGDDAERRRTRRRADPEARDRQAHAHQPATGRHRLHQPHDRQSRQYLRDRRRHRRRARRRVGPPAGQGRVLVVRRRGHLVRRQSGAGSHRGRIDPEVRRTGPEGGSLHQQAVGLRSDYRPLVGRPNAPVWACPRPSATPTPVPSPRTAAAARSSPLKS